MSLEDLIKEELVTDTDTVLESHLGDVKEFLEIHQDGTIVIVDEYRDVDSPDQILIYLIGQRYAYEANLVDEDSLKTDFFYQRFDASDRTVRNWLQELRDSGLTKKDGQSDHAIVVENLPDIIDRLKGAIE